MSGEKNTKARLQREKQERIEREQKAKAEKREAKRKQKMEEKRIRDAAEAQRRQEIENQKRLHAQREAAAAAERRRQAEIEQRRIEKELKRARQEAERKRLQAEKKRAEEARKAAEIARKKAEAERVRKAEEARLARIKLAQEQLKEHITTTIDSVNEQDQGLVPEIFTQLTSAAKQASNAQPRSEEEVSKAFSNFEKNWQTFSAAATKMHTRIAKQEHVARTIQDVLSSQGISAQKAYKGTAWVASISLDTGQNRELLIGFPNESGEVDITDNHQHGNDKLCVKNHTELLQALLDDGAVIPDKTPDDYEKVSLKYGNQNSNGGSRNV